ncbi:MAG: threonine/serine dehydratase [Gammaproteobacteria bacterium]|jgi:threonine dehydratase|nr:threonine/serine dehydratase [Gammaproteobacteria bacterium]
MLDLKNEVLNAQNQIRSYIRETPLDFSVGLSKTTNAQVYLKCENIQYTGSFKVRGALNKLLSLSLAERNQGVVTASSGNHGAAVAYGLKKLNIPGIVFVPENTSIAKIENIRNYDASLEFYATDCMQTEMYAREYAKKHNMIYVSPYNDLQVVAGQGTIGLEITRQLDKIDAIFVPIGGGGLISGIAGYVKSISPKIQVIGCLPENSPVMANSIKAGKIIEMETKPTLSDATAGGIEPGAITFDLCKNLVDDFIVVSEQEIKNALITIIKTQHYLVEGASGVALASLLKNRDQFVGKNVVVILSGANISFEKLKDVLS